MSLGEVWARVVELAWRGMETTIPEFYVGFADRDARRGAHQKALAEVGALHLYFSRFDTAGSTPPRVPAFQSCFLDGDRQLTQLADATRAGSVRLFGEPVALPPGEPNWHQDWRTGRQFSAGFTGRIPAHPADLDPKRVWEINRQQFLVALGQSFWLTRREADAEHAVQLMESWIASNPPFRGVNWTESLEAGLRLLSWLWTLRLLDGSAALNEQVARRVLTTIVLQSDFIRRHLSTYSSPNTHLLGEALALFVTGSVLPQLRGAGDCARLGQRILEEQLSRQVAPDGSHREKSAYYHCYALEMYLLATILGRQHGVAFAPDWNARVEQMAEFLMHILGPDGSLARFGDDDGGKTLRLADEDYYHPRSLLAVAAVVFARNDFKFVAGQLPQEVFWLLGPEGVSQFEQLTATPPARAQRPQWFPEASVGVLRTGWNADDAWLLCQGNPMGMLTAGHSHAAPLHFELYLGGQAVVVDPGTYSYAEQPWRDHFRSAEAHNTVTVDGLPWARPAGPFRWHGADNLGPVEQRMAPSALHLTMAHPSGSYVHHRIVELVSRTEAVIRDEFRGSGAHELAFWLHFAPGCTIRAVGAAQFEIVSGKATFHLTLDGFQSPACTLYEGQSEPPAGWFSPGYNRKAAAPALRIVERAEFPAHRTLRFSGISQSK